jgi:hypothetical protein
VIATTFGSAVMLAILRKIARQRPTIVPLSRWCRRCDR